MSNDYQRSLPPSQQVEATASRDAALWARNPANAMTLPKNLIAADGDGDGLIDRAEFDKLMKAAGAHGLTFDMVDKDGSGQITMEELQKMQDLNRGKSQARIP